MRGWRGRRVLTAVGSWVLVVAGCSAGPPQERVGARDTDSLPTETRKPDSPQPRALVEDSAVGCLEIGASTREVRRSCGEFEDTTIQVEGRAQPAVWVEVRQSRVLAEIVADSVWRIRVTDPTLTTRDAIAVGVPVRRLADLPGVRIARGEGTFVRTDAHCGISFEVHGLPWRLRPSTAAEIGGLPDSVRIARILVVGRCPGIVASQRERDILAPPGMTLPHIVSPSCPGEYGDPAGGRGASARVSGGGVPGVEPRPDRVGSPPPTVGSAVS